MNLRNTVLMLTLVAVCVPLGAFAQTATYSVSPPVIDHITEPRDIISETVSITNYGSRRATIYATVNAVALDSGGAIESFVQAAMSDRSSTVTSWLEISRGRIEVMPGETVTVPLTIRVNYNAEPGEYHAFIGFGSGSKRDEVQARALQGLVPGVVVRLSIPEKRTEHLQLKTFSIDRVVTNPASALITYELENTGDITQLPAGRILFYDSRNREVAELSLASKSSPVAPGETVTYTTEVPATGAWGRHKAFLQVDYGVNQRASVYDTTFFHVIPLVQLLIIFVVVLALSVGAVLLFHRRLDPLDDEDDDAVLVQVRSGVTTDEKDHDINLRP